MKRWLLGIVLLVAQGDGAGGNREWRLWHRHFQRLEHARIDARTGGKRRGRAGCRRTPSRVDRRSDEHLRGDRGDSAVV